MEIHLKVWNQNMITQTRVLSNEAFFTFVALDENKRPKKVPEIIAETEEQIKYFDGALRRRQLRLILSGKMKPDDATELKALFITD
jgi:acyl-CoA hydrolase